MINCMRDNCDVHKTKSDCPPQTASRLRPFQCCFFSCGFFLIAPALLVCSYFAIDYLLQPTAYSPIRFSYQFVRWDEIPDIMKELSGEWVIELPDTHFTFQTGMEGWRETRFVLNEDGTCEIHNLTLAMTNPYSDSKRYPEWTKRKLSGTWEMVPFWNDNINFIIHGETEHTVETRDHCYCSGAIKSYEKIEIKNGNAENDYYCSGFIQVWKVKENAKETYKLRMLGDPYYAVEAEIVCERTGIILKRME